MKVFVPLLALAIAASAPAALARSNAHETVIRDMERAGYPASCVERLTTNDVVRVRGLENDPDLSEGKKNKLIRDHYDRVCKRT